MDHRIHITMVSGLIIPKGWICLCKIKGATKWQYASASLNTCIIWIFIAQESRRGYIFIRLCGTLGDISHTIWMRSFNIIYIIHEMGVFINSNWSVGRGGLRMHVSLTLVVVVNFTEHVLTIVFIAVMLFISQETEGLYLIIHENNHL